MHTLFVYGTLRCPDIMAAVSGHEQEPVAATVSDHRVLEVNAETYPGMVPAEGHVAEGAVYRNVSDDAMARLDGFEGKMYFRGGVEVQFADGTKGRAVAYLFEPSCAHCLSDRPWRFDRFVEDGKHRFIAAHLAGDET